MNILIIEPESFFITDLIPYSIKYGDQIYVVSNHNIICDDGLILYKWNLKKDLDLFISYIIELKLNLSYVFTPNEMYLDETNQIQSILNLSCSDNKIPYRNKFKIKKIINSDEKLAPEGLITNKLDVIEFQKRFCFPVVIKPNSGFGSCGVRKANNVNELIQIFRDVKKVNFTLNLESLVLIEEYIDGDEFSIDTFWQDSEPIFDGILKKNRCSGPSFSDKLYYYTPHLNPELELKLKDHIYKAGRKLGVTNGITHAEIRVNDKGLSMIEITGRPGGGGLLLKPLFSTSYGLDCLDLFYKVITYRKVSMNFNKEIMRSDNINYLYIIPSIKSGHFCYIEGIDQVKSKNKIIRDLEFVPQGGYVLSDFYNPTYLRWLFGSLDSKTDIELFMMKLDSSLYPIYS